MAKILVDGTNFNKASTTARNVVSHLNNERAKGGRGKGRFVRGKMRYRQHFMRPRKAK